MKKKEIVRERERERVREVDWRRESVVEMQIQGRRVPQKLYHCTKENAKLKPVLKWPSSFLELGCDP